VIVVAVTVLFTLMQPALHAQGKTPAKTQEKKASGKTMTAQGVVKSVGPNSLTVTATGGKEMTFNVDTNTRIVGKGLSTKSKQQGNLTVPEAVGANDRVSVSYLDMNGTMHAATVTITAKSTMKK